MHAYESTEWGKIYLRTLAVWLWGGGGPNEIELDQINDGDPHRKKIQERTSGVT
jgi:hypothetical protein